MTLPLLKEFSAAIVDPDGSMVEPTRVLVIGDSSNDACAARAAGCRMVLVSYGYNHGVPSVGRCRSRD